MGVKRTIAIRLRPRSEQAASLLALREAFVAACNAVSRIACENRCTNRVRLHHLAYYRLREQFPQLGSQMTCNAIAAAAHSLKAHRANGREYTVVTFMPTAAVHVDARTYCMRDGSVSIYTLDGRAQIAFCMGEFQRSYLQRGTIREAELVHRRGRWYLHVVLELPDVAPARGGAVLGVDLGEQVAAATSLGTLHGGGQLRDARDRFLALRTRLQRNGSQSAKQLLAKVSGRESRHARHVNHEISSKIIREAVVAGCAAIALENLSNIRLRMRVGKRMRTRLHRWAWRQLQRFVEYKAQAAGIAVVYVDPSYTSQTCSACGRLGNRLKHRFSCGICGSLAHSDRNAARNLARLGASALVPTGGVMRPHVAAV